MSRRHLADPLPNITIESVNSIARAQKRRATGWLAGFLESSLVLAWIAEASYGPAADVVSTLAAFLLLGVLFFSVFLYGLHKEHRYALRDAQDAYYKMNPRAFWEAHRDLLEIPWR